VVDADQVEQLQLQRPVIVLGLKKQRLRQIAGDGLAHQWDRVVQPAFIAEPAGKTVHFRARGKPLGLAKGDRNDRGKAGQREDVDRIVVNDRLQRLEVAAAKILEVEGRNESALDVAVPLKREGEQWRVYVPVPNEPGLRAAVAYLNAKAKDYTRSLEKVHGWIMDKTIQTKDDLEEKLESELRQAGAFK